MSLELSGTTPAIKGVAGSVSAPAITGDDADTGISFPAADTIKFSTGGVERMAITNSGVTGVSGGKILHVDSIVKTDTASASVAQGAVSSALISLSYAATSSSNTLIIIANVNLGMVTAANIYATLLIGGSASAFIGDAASNRQRVSSASPEAGSATNIANFNIVYRLSSPSTSSTVYGVAGSHAQDGTETVYLNRTHGDSDSNFIARTASSITILEVAA